MITISEYALDLLEDLQVCAQEYVYLKDKGGDNGSCELSSITLQKYISSLETELAALKAELARYEWQSGHPEHENMVFVYMKDDYGNKYYGDNRWRQVSGRWQNTYSGKHILAWSEIRPYKGE